MPNNSVGGVSVSVWLDDKDALQELGKLRRKLEDLQRALSEKRERRDSIAAEMEQAEAAAERARQKVKKLQEQLAAAQPGDRAGIRTRLTEANADLREQIRSLDGLNRQWQKLDMDIAAGEQSLAGMTERSKLLAAEVRGSTGAMAKLRAAVGSAARSMQASFSRLGRMISRVFVFTVILSGLRALREYLGDLVLSFPEVREALAEIKGNLMTAAQPVTERLIPAFVTLLQILVQVSAVLADIVSKIFGTTAARSRESAKALYEQSKAYKKTGDAARAASRQLASFDQLNVLHDNSSSGGGGTDAGAITPSFDGGFMAEMEDKIGALELLLGEAFLVLGAILTFSGVNIPLGIALIALGAASIAAAAGLDWDTLKSQMEGPIGRIFALVAGAALVLGAILAFSGFPGALPLGIALMVIGAAGLATAAALNWDSIREELTGPMAGIYALLAGSLLVIGAILAFSSISIPLGIALMAAGAAGLATVAALNWDKIKAYLKENVAWTDALVSGALLVLGIILVASGALPLGIALIAAGAAGLVTVTALNWDKIKAYLKENVAWTDALVSGALLVLGIILVASGALPLGIALIAAGAAGLVTVTALKWDEIKQKIVGVWDSIRSWWQAHVAPVFTAEWWEEKFSSISEGLRTKIKDGVNAAIDLLNTFVDWVNDKMHLSWGSFSLFGKEVIPAGEFQLLTLPKIPRLAQGAVIPPNREFLAVLGDQRSGTNIETPLETMVQAFRQALGENGGGDLHVSLYLDGARITDAVIKDYNRRARASGRLSTL